MTVLKWFLPYANQFFFTLKTSLVHHPSCMWWFWWEVMPCSLKSRVFECLPASQWRCLGRLWRCLLLEVGCESLKTSAFHVCSLLPVYGSNCPLPPASLATHSHLRGLTSGTESPSALSHKSPWLWCLSQCRLPYQWLFRSSLSSWHLIQPWPILSYCDFPCLFMAPFTCYFCCLKLSLLNSNYSSRSLGLIHWEILIA